MKKGRLNKTELSRVARMWKELDEMISQIPSGIRSDDGAEADTLDVLVISRNKLGELIRYQDYKSWVSLKEGTR